MDVYENLAASKLDDVKISVVLREAPPKLRDNLLVNSQQFESNCYKLRPIIQSYMNSNKSWIANDFRSDTKASDLMEVYYIDKGQRSKVRQTRQRVLRVRKERALRTRLLVTRSPAQNRERGGRCNGGCRRSRRVCVHD